jgi:hypothetical protein
MSNPVNLGYLRWLTLMGLVIGFSLPFAVSAESANLQGVPTPPPAPPTHLVRELLEEDAQRALLNERLNHAPKAPVAPGITPVSLAPTVSTYTSAFEPGPAPPVPSVSTVRLKGIVGVGGQLSAIVNIEGQDVLYRAGQALPAMGPDKGLRLVRIASPCIQFTDIRHDTQKPLSVCLNEVRP